MSQLLCASIQSFKGMESDVVFVTEMAKVHPDQAIQMSYTAAHARHHLCIFDLEKAAGTPMAGPATASEPIALGRLQVRLPEDVSSQQPRMEGAMARHDVRFTIPERGLGSADIEFAVHRNGERLGLLKVSKGAVVWRHANKKRGYLMNWATLDRLMQSEGRRERLR
jgi:hypothetical protein